MDFFNWYFGRGLQDYLKIWKNFLWFSVYLFSTKRLFLTLFTPWKRSILPVDWEGFHPIKAINRFIADTYFRFFGGIVRLIIIFGGLFLSAFIFCLGLIILIIWMLLPVALLSALGGMFFQFISFVSIFIILLFFIGIILFSYKKSMEQNYADMNLAQLSRQKFFQRIIKRAGIFKKISPDDFLKNFSDLDNFLPSIGLSREEIQKIISLEVIYQIHLENSKKFWTREFLNRIRPFCRYLNYGYTMILDKYGEELTNEDFSSYRDVELINYESELELTINAITRNNQNCVLLAGEPGIGRSSIIHYLARLIRQQEAGEFLNYRRIIQIDLLETASDAIQNGENVENFLHKLFREAAFAGNIILALKNFDSYFLKENKTLSGLVSVIQEYLPFPSFSLLATSSVKGYHNLIEPHQNIVKNLEVIEVKEPSEEETIQMILQHYEKAEEENVFLSYQTIREVVKKSDDLGKIMPLPGRAMDLLKKIINFKQSHQEKSLDAELVNDYVELKTGVPQGSVEQSEKGVLLNLEDALHKRVIGQKEAIKKIAEAIRRARTAIHDENKPIGSFLFLGPTGVGKTETAKALAETYYKNENSLVRFDMNEYSSHDSVSSLIGSRQNNTQGQLSMKIKDNPFSVILLDELEKADKEVHNIFLQALDEGYLTDALGEKISFRGNIIIATSNAGSAIIKEMIEKKGKPEEISKKLTNYLIKQGIFETEFVNRFDAVVFFEPFSDSQLRDVIKLMLANFSKKLKKEQNIQVDYEMEVIEKIISDGYDPIFGARSVRRYLDNKVKNIVSDKLLSREEKIDKIIITVKDLD